MAAPALTLASPLPAAPGEEPAFRLGPWHVDPALRAVYIAFQVLAVARLGDHAEALGRLEGLVDGGWRHGRFLASEPLLQPMARTPAFRELLARRYGMLPVATMGEARAAFPGGWKAPRPYLRIVADPAA